MGHLLLPLSERVEMISERFTPASCVWWPLCLWAPPCLWLHAFWLQRILHLPKGKRKRKRKKHENQVSELPTCLRLINSFNYVSSRHLQHWHCTGFLGLSSAQGTLWISKFHIWAFHQPGLKYSEKKNKGFEHEQVLFLLILTQHSKQLFTYHLHCVVFQVFQRRLKIQHI